MNKTVRSLLLQSPKAYNLLHTIKNNYLLSFYLKQVHEPDYNAFKLFCDDRPQLFLDIGANVGMSALSFFTLKENSQVISFEPNPINYPYLERLTKKFTNFQYFTCGLGDKPESIDFYFPIYNGREMTTLGSCNYDQAQGWLNSDTIYFFKPQKLKVEKIHIEVKTLDSFKLNPDFIKIDVEGFEHQVLLGSHSTIKKNRPVLLIEGVAAEDQAHQLLQTWKYNTYQFYQGKFYQDQFDCSNNFFVPQEKTQLVQPHLAN